MSIALESSGGGGSGGGGRYKIVPPGLISRINFMPMYGSSNPPTAIGKGGIGKEQDPESSSSSIGKNSDLSVDSAEGEDSGDNEAQSDFKGPLDSLDSLEDVLPTKKGISKFYSGKSKSFASLADTCTISANDLAKPENVYSKKRKNLLASTLYWEKKAGKTSKHNCSSGLYKRQASGMLEQNSSNNNTNSNMEQNSSNNNTNSNTSSSSPPLSLPPLHPKGFSPSTACAPPQLSIIPPCRSLSLSDLQTAAASNPGGK